MSNEWLKNLKVGDKVLVEKPAYLIASLCEVESVGDVIVTAKTVFHGSGHSHSLEDGLSLPVGGCERGDFVLKEPHFENIGPYLRGWLRETVHNATAPGQPLLPLETLRQLAAICEGAQP